MFKFFTYCLPFLFFFPFRTFAQDKDILKNKALLKQYLDQSTFEIDTQANAVILYEETNCNYHNGSYEYSYEIIAKILNKAAIDDLSLVNIFKRDNTTFMRASGETYNLQNGEITVTKLQKDDILKDRLDEDYKLTKFILPGVKTGSVIHYSYTIHKSDVAKIPDWNFQHQYPTLASRFELRLPQNISCNKIMRSRRAFKEVTSEKILDECDACEYMPQYVSDTRLITWSVRNVPAFKEEPFSSSPDNFKERLRVMITDIFLGSGEKRKLYNTWDDYSKGYLFKSDNFIGQVFNANGFLDETVEQLTSGKNTDLDKAKTIYAYVRRNITTVDFDDKEENIKTVLKTKKGDLYGVNLLLIALLKRANLNCDPVVLSSKKRERLIKDYPNPYAVDYIVGLFIDGKDTFYLDAAGGILPFGVLMPQCYNGYARVVNKKGASIWLSPDDISDKSLTTVNVSPSENQQELFIKVDRNLGIYSSINYRNQWHSDLKAAKNAIVQMAVKNNLNLLPDSISIEHLQDPEERVQIHYQARMTINNGTDMLYFDPYLYPLFEQNPFTSITRNLPIEMDYKESWNYLFNFRLPAGYEIEDLPKSTIIKLNTEGEMAFTNLLTYEKEENLFQLKSSYNTRTTFFSPDIYQNIRSLYAKVLEEQKKKIVLIKPKP